MKSVILIFFWLCGISLSCLLAQPQFIDFIPFPPTVHQYQPQFSSVKIKAQLANPFDVNEFQVNLILKSPSGKKIVQPGFFDGYDNGLAIWRIRFTPSELGRYSYQLKLQANYHAKSTKSFSFKSIASGRNGFIRTNPNSDYTFQFDSGRLFRGFGENLCWADDYEYYFKKLNAIGCNFVRIWMCPWNLYLEWSDPGLGRYHLPNAVRLDSVLTLAERYHIYIMLCFDYHGVVQREEGYFKEKKWDENPYNQKNGGPCANEADFFNHPIAKRYYKNRLRYIVARYAFSPQILAWEFWNEVDLTAGRPEDVVAWHKEMAAYLRQIDPYDHLITTSFAHGEYDGIWEIPEIDFTQTHLYNRPNFAELIPAIIDRYRQTYGKPHVVGEFGSDYRGAQATRENDPDNVALHNGLWAGLFARTPISPLSWWWDELIDADDLYFHFQAITRFALNVATGAAPIERLELADIVIPKAAPANDSLLVFPAKGWQKIQSSHFEIREDGGISDRDQIPAYLFGSSKPDMKQPIDFKITYKANGKFTVHVDEVSDFGLLKIYLDGKLALEQPLPLGPGEGQWERSEWKPEINMFQGVYDKPYGIEVPAGLHTIRVDNDGRDWIKIKHFLFENTGLKAGERIKVVGVQQDSTFYLWLRHERYQWQFSKEKILDRVPETSMILTHPMLTSSGYRVEWWDPYRGKILAEQRIDADHSNVLKLNIPSFKNDIAGKIYVEHSK
ncbi:MAG: DUF5060 domain-containing protein [candidate division KSB1 bacterium]|nr:DUF5060 domain-containing protein [candidate division KSB1 bacterium]